MVKTFPPNPRQMTFSEPPRRADSQHPIFIFCRILGLGHLRGPGVSLNRILGGGVVNGALFWGGGSSQRTASTPTRPSPPPVPPQDFAGVEAGMAELAKDLKLLLSFWLHDRSFICGARPSIADLAIAMPLLMVEATAMPLSAGLQQYLARMAREFEAWDNLTAPFLTYLDSQKGH